MSDVKKLARKLKKIANELTDGNYHAEAGLLYDILNAIKKNENITVEDILKTLIERDWYL